MGTHGYKSVGYLHPVLTPLLVALSHIFEACHNIFQPRNRAPVALGRKVHDVWWRRLPMTPAQLTAFTSVCACESNRSPAIACTMEFSASHQPNDPLLVSTKITEVA
jgi:hypothetical protein